MDFTNLSDLWKYVDNQIEKSMDDIGREARDLLQQYILSTVYANHQVTYDRTYQFLRAITVSKPFKVDDAWTIELFIDPDKIEPIYNPDGWNKHMSMDGSDYSEYLAITLEEGAESPHYSTPAFHYMQMTEDEIKRSQMHIKALIGFMKTKGINIV